VLRIVSNCRCEAPESIRPFPHHFCPLCKKVRYDKQRKTAAVLSAGYHLLTKGPKSILWLTRSVYRQCFRLKLKFAI
jgi:hypothetical protein